MSDINTRGITKKQMYAMNRLHARKIEGFNLRGRWRYLDSSRGEEHTSQIEALKERGIVEMSYYAGGKAGVYFTEAGREWYASASYEVERD